MSLGGVAGTTTSMPRKTQPLDMLFLNAGIPDSPPNPEDGSLRLSEDGIEKLFATNVVGHRNVFNQ